MDWQYILDILVAEREGQRGEEARLGRKRDEAAAEVATQNAALNVLAEKITTLNSTIALIEARI